MDGAVGHGSKGFVVGDNNEGLTHLVAKVEEEAVQLLLVLRIQRTAGLVGKDNIGLIDKGTGNGHTLLLASGKLVGLMVGTVGKFHELEQLQGTLTGLALTGTGYHGGYHDILECRELGQQLMELEDEADVLVTELAKLGAAEAEDILPPDENLSAIGLIQRAHNLQQRGLTGSAGAHDGHHLATLYLQVDATQYLQSSETLGYILKTYHFISLSIEH